LLVFLGAHPILHSSRIRVKFLLSQWTEFLIPYDEIATKKKKKTILILIFIMRSSDPYKAKSPLNIELVNG
jgi:hypothetical protein